MSELNSSVKIDIIIMECHANCLARIESDWTMRDGVNFLIRTIELILALLRTVHCLFLQFFLITLNLKMASDGDTEMLFSFIINLISSSNLPQYTIHSIIQFTKKQEKR